MLSLSNILQNIPSTVECVRKSIDRVGKERRDLMVCES